MSQERTTLIAGNWKMNGGLDEVDGLAGDLAGRMAGLAAAPGFVQVYTASGGAARAVE